MNEIETRYGPMQVQSEHDLISRSLQMYGEWAGSELKILLGFIRAGDCVLDVGAFIGTHSRAFSEQVGATGKVMAFEPNPDAVATLIWNQQHAAQGNILIYGVAVGNQAGTVSLDVADEDNFGATHLGDGISKGLVVQMLPLDALNIEHCEFIKLDVEGFESQVLEGAIDLVTRCRPVIFMEINSLHDGGSHITWARQNRYDLYGVLSDAYSANNWRGEPDNMFGPAKECGILAIPADHADVHQGILDELGLPRLRTEDDLVLLLLHKPQYPHEILAVCSAHQVLDLKYGSPEADHLRFTLSETLLDLTERTHLFTAEKTRLTEEARMRDTFIAQLEAKVQRAEQQRDDVAGERDDVARQRDDVVRERDDVAKELDSIFQSRSWRITRPLRRLGKLTRGMARLRKKVNVQTAQRAMQLVRQGQWNGIYHRGKRLIDEVTYDDSDAAVKSYVPPLRPLLERMLATPPEFPARLDRTVDIIVPVYNGWDHLTFFFDALLAHSEPPYNLLVINDASTDPRVAPYLNDQRKRFPSMRLLTNSVNRGFVQTVNRGMQESTNDVVLLNTDTRVPPFWVERLLAPLGDSAVASVTPFTNAGTICSFPICCQDNESIYGLDVQQIDAAFSRLRAGFISIPTGVGFCMALSRAALEMIGLFDAEAFGRGYGEENDWCMRALQAGYHHVLCNNLYVQHAHGGSFHPMEKQRLLDANLQTLNKRYPDYGDRVFQYISKDPASVDRDAARILLMCDPSHTPVLYIDHARGGGANQYRHRQKEMLLKEGRAVCIYTVDYLTGSHHLECSFGEDTQEYLLQNITDLDDFILNLGVRSIVYNSLVFADNPGEYVRWMGQLPETVHLQILMHDFYPICPSYTLLNGVGKFCQVPELSDCVNCLIRHPDVFPNSGRDIHQWRKDWSLALQRADEIVCFSADTVAHVLKAYPAVRDNIVVRPHTIDHLQLRTVDWSAADPLHVAVIGAINKQKGAAVLQQFARYVTDNNIDCQITLIGELDPNYVMPEVVTITGRYSPGSLPELIEGNHINLVWFPAIWPETFSYVTAECMAMGLPIACFDLGAPAERIRDYRLGAILQSEQPEYVYAGFQKLIGRIADELI
jgi:FkbM family methyltransferase